MALVEKVFFPPPPPTCNTLSPTERAHLMRSANKLTRVLGVTPQILDVGEFDTTTTVLRNPVGHGPPRATTPVYPEPHSLPRQSSTRSIAQLYANCRQASSSSAFSILHDYNDDNDDDDDERLRSNSALLKAANRNLELRMKSAPTWRPTLLRVVRSPHSQPTLDPNRPNQPPPPYSESEESDGEEEEGFVDTPSVSGNSGRRKKMERLHRILGEEVPVSIVFPASRRSDESCSDSDSGYQVFPRGRSHTVSAGIYSSPIPSPPLKRVVSQTGFQPPPPPLSPPPTTTTITERPLLGKHKIAKTRDSIGFSFPGPHKAPRRGSPPPPRRPHYRLRSSLCGGLSALDPTEGQPPANMRPELVDGRTTRRQVEEEAWASLRTITESPDELVRAVPAVGVAERNRVRGASLDIRSSDTSSFMSEWYWSDDDIDGAHTEETLVEKKEEIALDVKEEALPKTKQVWSHKRKLPPVYEP